LGINKETGRETYRCAKILSTLTTLKHYELGNTRTNLAANVQIGTKEKGYRLNYLSNQPISASEFLYFKTQCEKDQISLPNYKKLKAKAQEVEDHKKKELSAAEFDKMIKTKKAFQLKPTSFARDKSELKMAIQAAEENSKPVEAQRMREKLARLENESVQRDETRVSELKNIEKINKAVENHNKLGVQAVRAANEKHRLSTTANPFTRRKTMPIMSTSKKDNQRVSEHLGKRYLAQVDTSYEQKTFVNEAKAKAAELKKNSFNLNNHEASIESAHNFDIDIDIDVSNLDMPDVPKLKNVITETSLPKKKGVVDLSEYKRRKGLI